MVDKRDDELSINIFDDKIIREIEDLLVKYRDQFNCTSNKKRIVDPLELMTLIPLLEELKNYYNNDLCVAVSTSVVMLKNIKFNTRTQGYYLENALTRINNIWEYLHIIENQQLNTGLIVGTELRDAIIEAKSYKFNFIKEDNKYKIEKHRLNDEEIKKSKESARREFKLFNNSPFMRNSKFYKYIKKTYEINDPIKSIKSLYESEEVKEALSLRNTSVHKKALSSKFSIGHDAMLIVQTIDINPTQKNFEGFDEMLEKNLIAIQEAIKILVNSVYDNDIPNLKENEGEKFYIKTVLCKKCSKNTLIDCKNEELLEKFQLPIICSECGTRDIVLGEKIEVNDQKFYKINITYYKRFIELMKKN